MEVVHNGLPHINRQGPTISSLVTASEIESHFVSRRAVIELQNLALPPEKQRVFRVHLRELGDEEWETHLRDWTKGSGGKSGGKTG